MEKLNLLVDEALKMAENAMYKEGSANPKIVLYYRDNNNGLGTYMVDLAPQQYFDDRMDIMKNIGSFISKQEGIRSFDTAVTFGEAIVTVDGVQHTVIMASAMDSKGASVSRYKEIRHYIMPEHPEKQFADLQDFKLDGFEYKSPMLTTLFSSFETKKK